MTKDNKKSKVYVMKIKIDTIFMGLTTNNNII